MTDETKHPEGISAPKSIRTGRGAREGYFVYAPSIATDTYLHLVSTRKQLQA
jgi:hypothetical protein